MDAMQELIERRGTAERLAEAAEARARELALADPKGSAAALKEANDAAIEAEVASLAAEERERLDAQDAERKASAARAAAERELRDVTAEQNAAARRFDAAASELQGAFDELETLCRRAERLRAQAGLPAARDFAGRTVGLTRAVWHGCPGVAKRLRLGFAPGRGRTPLADAYPREN